MLLLAIYLYIKRYSTRIININKWQIEFADIDKYCYKRIKVSNKGLIYYLERLIGFSFKFKSSKKDKSGKVCENFNFKGCLYPFCTRKYVYNKLKCEKDYPATMHK